MTAPNPDDVTRPRRMAIEAAHEYYRLSREHATGIYGPGKVDYAIACALQGILRLLIFHTEEGLK